MFPLASSSCDHPTSHAIEIGLPPDIVEATLPYLSTSDIKSLSMTNKYFYKLLDFKASDTLWHELFRKSFGSLHSNVEPLESKTNSHYMSCCELILRTRFPDESWGRLYQLRALDAKLYTWGSLKHARLGFTAASNLSVSPGAINNAGMRLQFGINSPVPVPWDAGSHAPTLEDESIACVSAGGFSFQILTKSGKLYYTGSTYSGGHRGPGPVEGAHDYNLFQQMITHTEQSLTIFNGRTPRHGGLVPINTTSRMPLERPHEDIYARFEDLEESLDQRLGGNKHIRRLFTNDVLKRDTGNPNTLSVDTKTMDNVRIQSISSGRSHILALSTDGDIYSWDGPEVERGVKLVFDGLPHKFSNPILKIGSGWNYNCVSIYNIGLVVWSSRCALQENDTEAKANYKVIHGTHEICGDEKVVDFACCANMCVFFITAKGDQLWLYSNEEVHKVGLPFPDKLVKLVGCYTMLAIFTTSACYTVNVVDGRVEETSLVKLELENEDDMFVSLATGDYHTVALTSRGKIYTWGLESELCGCLGLGSRDQMVNERRVGRIENLRSTRVIKPSLVNVDNRDYVCLAVAAGGWQTGALILE
ncbi:LADA_0E01200g1_1 [Lachancea dasiensis]|uniref:LADA_0E01200g1_1 n=1 Tax=Lachancea dasiensis TaxID=1072105 RepID=A0A1G4JAW5_9SACH|nr:LADA_0E01200g1_1 [Lachancea dasiensis]